MDFAAVSVGLHALAAVVWVGGMAFAYVFLRPAVAKLLAGPERLQLWRDVFARFFPVVWLAVGILLATGYHLVFSVFGGFGQVGAHVHVMHALAWLMTLIYAHVFFAPWRRLRRCVDAEEYAAGATELSRIRRFIGINLVLGVIVVAVATSGRWW